MDILTHTLFGLLLARVGLARGEKGASAMLVLAANLPDADGYGYLTNSVAYIEQHRGYAHALVFTPVVALAAMVLIKLALRTRMTLSGYAACLVAVLVHVLLDWTSVHGVRLLLPFSSQFYRLDISDGFDPLILAILIAAWSVPLAISLLASHLSSRRIPGPIRSWAWLGLLTVSVYEGGRWLAHEHATTLLATHTYKGRSAQHVSVFPVTLFEWRGLVEGDGFLCEARVDIRFNFDPRKCRFEYPARSSQAIDAARTTPAFQAFEKFSEHPFWILSPAADALRVELIDLRFGSVQRPGLAAVAIVQRDGHIRDAGLSFGKPRWSISKSGLRFEF